MQIDPDRQRTRDLVLKYGWNTTCYQIVNPCIDRWFSDDSVVGYVERQGVRVVAGAPVCPMDSLEATLQAFEATAEGHVCYFGAEERMRQATRTKGKYSCTVLGAQPVWSPESWQAAFDGDASLRFQRNRARNKHVAVREWTTEQATNHPELRRVLEEWLATRGLPTMHFLVEPETLDFLEDRRVFVAEQEGEVVGFTTLCPIPLRKGWLTEQFVRGAKAPNGTVELMVDYAVGAVGSEGSEFVTMGMVPLSTNVRATRDTPGWLKFMMGWMRAHGRRFYNFDGLNWFKQKFHPDRWDPIYAISSEPHISFRTINAIATAFTGMPPWLAVLRGGVRGLKQEARWLLKRKR